MSRETFSIRLSTEEKTTLRAEADRLGLKLGEYARWRLLQAPPVHSHPVYATSSSPPYDALATQVNHLSTTLDNLAQVDSNVARALDQARAALGPEEES